MVPWYSMAAGFVWNDVHQEIGGASLAVLGHDLEKVVEDWD